jgi:hypothetical protein
LIYHALLSSTGMRTGAALRVVGTKIVDLPDDKLGMRWSDLAMWVVPGDSNNNEFVTYATPRTNKVVAANGVSYPLFSTPHLGLSANRMLLLSAELRGGLEHPLQSILDPAFIKNGRPRRIRVKEEL